MARCRILVLDEDPAVRVLIRTVLERAGHDVDTVRDAQGAMEQVSARPYGLLLLNAWTPGAGGLEVFRRLQEGAPSLANRVVFLTSDLAPHDTHAILEQTGAATIAKPFKVDELLEAARKVLRSDDPSA